ncbi:MAG: serine/threonine-protein kinase [Betaproteobacteria bacterium]|nr:serine/threonine-protein kinase [Betaproteobacteria bacterium]
MNTLEQLRSGQLAGARRVQLACGLTEFPREVFALADTLEILDLSGNALSSLPEDLPRLGKLRILFCSDNRFTALPEVLGRCAQLTMVGFKANQIRTVSGQALPPLLRWLILTDNQIEALPAELGRCSQLQKLMLAGNRLQALPPELAACSRLELLRIAANDLGELPPWLFSMPRLSWLAFGGNPFCQAEEAAAMTDMPIQGIAWEQLHLQHRLGEGASGVIHRAEQCSSDGARPVAVKLFKGTVTSDGLPHSEIAACIRAGDHPNLIPVLGKVENHPESVSGLVMSLIDTEFRNLAGPPSLDSCTRDIYGPEQRFSLASAVAIAQRIASVARHLHRRGIMHGDLYAHNILHCGQGRALLGDFGAASFFSPAEDAHALGLQRLEVRAFGCLLEELIAHSDAPPGGADSLAGLLSLKTACLDEVPEKRPLFADIEQTLALLAASRPTAGA